MKEIKDRIVGLIKGIFAYIFMVFDFFIGNQSKIVMFNILNITMVLLTIVSFIETLNGLRSNFFSTGIAILVTLGIQGTLVVLSLYIPIHYTNTELNKTKGNNLLNYIKRYSLWIPLLCCMSVSSFFSYVSISSKLFSQTEDLNNEFKVKEIISETYLELEEELYNQILVTENNINNYTEYILKEIDNIEEQEQVTTNEIDLEEYLLINETKYQRATENYQRYQDAMASTVDPTKREINETNAKRELEFIEEYERNKMIYENGDVYLDSNVYVINMIENTIKSIQDFNNYDTELKLATGDLKQEMTTLSERLVSVNKPVRINYLVDLIEHKLNLINFKEKLEEDKADILITEDLGLIKSIIFNAPFDKHIPQPTEEYEPIRPNNTFDLLERVYRYERLAKQDTSLEKSINYLVDGTFPILAYIALFMAFFIDSLVLIQGFSINFKIKKGEDMDENEKEEFIFWLLSRRTTYETEDGKVNGKVMDKLSLYCTPSENGARIYLDPTIRKDPEMGIVLTLMYKLGYVYVMDDVAMIDANLYLLYLQQMTIRGERL